MGHSRGSTLPLRKIPIPYMRKYLSKVGMCKEFGALGSEVCEHGLGRGRGGLGSLSYVRKRVIKRAGLERDYIVWPIWSV